MKVTGEWELNPHEIAALFKAKGWCYHTSKGLAIPTAEEIEHQLARLISTVLNSQGDQAQAGRFLLWKDPELPDSYDLWLHLGFIWDDEALDEDERTIIDDIFREDDE
ncbi:hypothetical protein ACIBG8_19510 [Nonomuraea sp. NPDC050556]|uniref:hypothetical protein n=1 Tax=Nonomuraea sp. NPDC050556 TaxID=3364369 RepID=UPI0037AA00EE